MKVLVACESSGIVRNSLLKNGVEAISCDLLPSELPGPHIQGDVRNILSDGWDMMIAFPPCTHLAVSGARYFEAKRADGRQQEGIDFFLALVNALIPRIAVENPVGIMSTIYRKPDQIIQPWEYGHPESKKTCLWLKGLSRLVPTDILKPTEFQANGKPRYRNQTPTGQNKIGPSADRWKLRSKTYQGIAEAMAEQWSNL